MSFSFGTPVTSASMEFAFGTPAGDAKSTKAESSLFGSTLATQNSGGYGFTPPSAGNTLGTSAVQPAPLFGTTFGTPVQSTASTFGTGTSIFSATRPGEDAQTIVSLPFGANGLATSAPLNSGTPTIQAVLPTYASSTVKPSPGSGLLGTAFQSPISIFGTTGQSITSTFAPPVQSTMPSLGVGQSTLSPAFGTTPPAAVNRFGTQAQAAVPSFGITTQSTANSSFGIPLGTAAPQFSFGAGMIAKPKITTSNSSFTPALGFVASTTTSTQPSLSFNFGNVPAAVTTPSTFSVGSNMPSSLPSAAIYTTATANTTAAATAVAATTTTHSVINSTAAPLDFCAGTFITTGTSAVPTIPTAVSRTAVNAASGRSAGSSITKPLVASLPTFGIGTSVSTSTVPTFSLGATTTATTCTSNVLGSSSLAATTTTAVVTTFTSVTPSITTSISSGFTIPDGTTTKTNTTAALSNVVLSSIMTYGQLEDLINKWTLDLENQCKIFANQAKQLNAWDRLLISNGDKILALNTSIERVKEQQHQLDQELDFIRAQQKELEHLIVPLEKELQETPVTDTDRNHTYQLAENMDSQLKQMSEDLKEIIETLNESNRNQELSNPITQIGRILNAHMNSLQWIDINTNKISSQLDQISKMHDLNRRNHEIVLQRTYD